VRWIVDGMNVIGSRPDGWWKDRNKAMAALVERLECWAAQGDARGDGVTVMFEQPPSPPIRSSSITVTHAARAAPNSADDEIVRLVAADARPQEIRVVTSDRTLADRVRAVGASVCPAASFRALIDPPQQARAAAPAPSLHQQDDTRGETHHHDGHAQHGR
jgi:predicted RNA-binding protein with PIN domain